MADQNLPPLDWRVPIVHGDGTPTDAFERAWNNQRTLNGGAVVDFTDLADVPSAYTTKAGYAVRVNAGASGLEFATQSAMLDGIGLTRGAILERGATGWQIISPGAANTLLTSAGAGSDPAWQALSAIIDAAIGSTRGAVLFRGASGWAILGPGTAGNFLQTAGAGADPLWAAASGGGSLPAAGFISGGDTTASLTYADLAGGAGPSATLTTGTSVCVVLSATINRSTAGNTSFMSCAVSGATTLAAADLNSVVGGQPSFPGATGFVAVGGGPVVITGLTAGSNTFTAKYRIDGGAAYTWARRGIMVSRLN